MIRHLQRPSLLPYTTLFRSPGHQYLVFPEREPMRSPVAPMPAATTTAGARYFRLPIALMFLGALSSFITTAWDSRSEEHTSELQSPVHLVFRLLLEKKNECA